MPNTMLRLRQVLKKVPMSRSWLYLEISQGRFPPPVKLGARAVGFFEDAVDAWLQERVEASQSSALPTPQPSKEGAKKKATAPATRGPRT